MFYALLGAAPLVTRLLAIAVILVLIALLCLSFAAGVAVGRM